MNKKGRVIYWSTLVLGLLAIFFEWTDYKNLTIYCLILHIIILQYAIVNYIDYKTKKK